MSGFFDFLSETKEGKDDTCCSEGEATTLQDRKRKYEHNARAIQGADVDIRFIDQPGYVNEAPLTLGSTTVIVCPMAGGKSYAAYHKAVPEVAESWSGPLPCKELYIYTNPEHAREAASMIAAARKRTLCLDGKACSGSASVCLYLVHGILVENKSRLKQKWGGYDWDHICEHDIICCSLESLHQLHRRRENQWFPDVITIDEARNLAGILGSEHFEKLRASESLDVLKCTWNAATVRVSLCADALIDSALNLISAVH